MFLPAVWQVERYIYFPADAARWEATQPALLERDSDEDPSSNALHAVAGVLTRVHQQLFAQADQALVRLLNRLPPSSGCMQSHETGGMLYMPPPQQRDALTAELVPSGWPCSKSGKCELCSRGAWRVRSVL